MARKLISAEKKYKKRIGPGRKKEAETDFSKLTMKDIATLFGVTVQAVSQWECPRNHDGTYNGTSVVKWNSDKIKEDLKPSSMNGLETQKLKLQCEKLEMEIDERKKNSITIEEHKSEMREAMLAFRGYFTDYGKMNLHLLVGQPIEQLRKYWNELVQLGTNHFSEAKEKN